MRIYNIKQFFKLISVILVVWVIGMWTSTIPPYIQEDLGKVNNITVVNKIQEHGQTYYDCNIVYTNKHGYIKTYETNNLASIYYDEIKEKNRLIIYHPNLVIPLTFLVIALIVLGIVVYNDYELRYDVIIPKDNKDRKKVISLLIDNYKNHNNFWGFKTKEDKDNFYKAIEIFRKTWLNTKFNNDGILIIPDTETINYRVKEIIKEIKNGKYSDIQITTMSR